MDKNENGAIVVEASIAVPVYIFIIFTILSIIIFVMRRQKFRLHLILLQGNIQKYLM